LRPTCLINAAVIGHMNRRAKCVLTSRRISVAGRNEDVGTKWEQ
jgi:hypothetical protein